MRALVLDKVSQLILPAAVVYAAHLLLHGHDRPGGGFSAGLVTALAVVIHAVGAGSGRVHARLSRTLRPALPLGLLVALAAGSAAVFAGDPFLTHYHGELRLGGRTFPVSTALAFDVGVYLVVVGVVAVALSRLARAGSAS